MTDFTVQMQFPVSRIADILDESDDGITADSFLQCVALGDIVYG